MDNREIGTMALCFFWSNWEPTLEDFRARIIDFGIAEKHIVMQMPEDELKKLILSLSKFHSIGHRSRNR